MSDRELTPEERRIAAGGDLNVLAVLMFVGSTSFALANWWIGLIGWIAVAATIPTSLGTMLGLIQRNEVIAAFVKIGFGVSGLVAPAIGLVGIVLGLFGFSWGWAMLGAAVVYFGFSVLGLEIIKRAEETGAIDEYGSSAEVRRDE